jgi:hypothetical protein
MSVYKGGFCKINRKNFKEVFSFLLEEEHLRATDELMKRVFARMDEDMDRMMKEVDDYVKGVDKAIEQFDKDIQNMFKNGK